MAKKEANPKLEAALKLAAAGYKIFPVPPGTKKSYLAKGMKWGSGEAWGMTKDPVLIERYWKRWPAANIGLPTGAVNGITVIETDTAVGHKLEVDGEVSLQTVQERLGLLPTTLMSESPSGSRHRFYTHPGGRVKNSASEIGPGIDVRGDGGMVVVPPSSRKDGVYRWLNKLPTAALPPTWVGELAKEIDPPAPRELPEDANWAERYAVEDEDKPSFEEVQEALTEIPNEDLGWERWNDVGMRIYVWSSSHDGLELFDWWSQQSSKYDRKSTQRKWQRYRRTPPTRYTSHSILNLAQYGFDYEGDDEPDEKSAEEPTAAKTNGQQSSPPGANGVIEPFDLWGVLDPPSLPLGLLPKLIEDYALALSRQTGCDPAAFAMGALLCCGAAMTDHVRIKSMQHSNWLEAPRLWLALIGDPSTGKTPAIRELIKPLYALDYELGRKFARALQEYEALEKEEQKEQGKPRRKRLVMEDATAAAAQEIFCDNSDGILCKHDELSSLFGLIAQNKGGSGHERGFWIQAWNGGYYQFHRVGRGTGEIENLSGYMLGGIQPEKIRRADIAGDDDGLLQRFINIVMRPRTIPLDEPIPPVAEQYAELIKSLYGMPREQMDVIEMTPEARAVRERFIKKLFHWQRVFKTTSMKLSSHLGKYEGYFSRLCLVIHVIENHTDPYGSNVSGKTAERIEQLIEQFLLPHAFIFYTQILSSVDPEHMDQVKAIGSLILTQKLSVVTNRMLQIATRLMRVTRQEFERVMDILDACAWVDRIPPKKFGATPRFEVRGQVLDGRFADRAEKLARDRQETREMLTAMRQFHGAEKVNKYH